jgi:hypothetical protein
MPVICLEDVSLAEYMVRWAEALNYFDRKQAAKRAKAEWEAKRGKRGTK